MPRRPGITFETVTPSVPDTLPRMDVAGFVGFATRGPIDRPVPVEDLDRFRDVFGPPLKLVSEAASGRTRTAHLHRAVEAFFRNGGRRCWVVRVANDPEATATAQPVRRTSFPVPGVVSVESGHPQTVRARCYSASFDDRQVGTVLRRRLLPRLSSVKSRGQNASNVGQAGELTLTWSLEESGTAADGTLSSGDLLCLREHADRRFAKETALVGYAPVVCGQQPIPADMERSTFSLGSDELSVTVRAGPVHVFRRVPDRLAVPSTGTSVPETRQTSVEVEILGPSGVVGTVPGATLVRDIGDTYMADDPPRFRLLIDPSNLPAEAGSASLESRYVHVRESGDDRFGMLYLGAERRSGGDEVEYEVHDALWTAPGRDAGHLAASDDVDVEKVDFDLLTWKDQELRGRLKHLGFAESHPRSWTDLPVDDELFTPDHGEATFPDPGTLAAEVFEPRFPLAAPQSTTPEGAGVFVPLGMPNRPNWTRACGRISSSVQHSRLKRERVARFSPQVFVDSDLSGTRTSTLRREADDKIYLNNESATGLHSLWSISEVTLLSVPDAVHRGWRSMNWHDPTPPATPTFTGAEVRTDAPTPYVRLAWEVGRRGSGNAPTVQVQEAQEPTFEAPVVRYRGDDTTLERFVDDPPKTLYFRVRIVGENGPGGWSQTRRVDVPAPAFTACWARRPTVPDVDLYVDQEDGRWLRWIPVEDPDRSNLEYEVQVDTLPTFETTERVTGGPKLANDGIFPLRSDPPGAREQGPTDYLWHDVGVPATTPPVRYARVRARRPSSEAPLHSPWSRTVTITHPQQQKRPLISKADYNQPQADTPGEGRPGLFDVHRAMLRFAAARKDVLSVLSIPETDEAAEAHRHASRLRTPGAVLETQEVQTLSYGALYYPWLLSSVEDGRRLVPTPPCGAACGTIADRTLRDGAWMAPANRTLSSTRSVVPPPATAGPPRLNDQNVNVFTEGPGGVRTLTASTLARTADLEPISTRRLLILVRRLALREGPELVFENNTPLLRRRIAEQFDDLLRRLFERGAFAGERPAQGYRVVTGSSVNPPEQVERGRLVVELRIAPSRPLQFLTVRLVQRGDGTTVAVEPAV